jgi:hypothetical protein
VQQTCFETCFGELELDKEPQRENLTSFPIVKRFLLVGFFKVLTGDFNYMRIKYIRVKYITGFGVVSFPLACRRAARGVGVGEEWCQEWYQEWCQAGVVVVVVVFVFVGCFVV